MYRPAAFAVDDSATLHRFIRDNPFATVAAAKGESVLFAYAPVVLQDETVRFHLAAGNPLAQMADGARLKFSFMGPNAYVSPDWYESAGKVPTWNYSVVEGEGIARRLDDAALRTLLVDISAAEEEKLLPKTPWTIDKVPQDKMTLLLKAIVGFSLRLETLQGKFKLAQNLTKADLEGAAEALDARGDGQSVAVADAMRRIR
jgi:transcriptional regulator